MKSLVLDRLKENMNNFISGETLSREIGVSRTAIWKNIRELKNEGYIIEAASKKGYKLLSNSDILNEYEIKNNLNTLFVGKHLIHLDTIDSTNNYAKIAAQEGCANGTLVVANSQTCGRGRLGRQWASADGKGIWMSIVLRPSLTPEEVQIITLAGSVAVVRAIYKSTGIKTLIKWPNDLILEGKKVCGILTEMHSEMDKINFLVMGIGVNINHEKTDFPEDIQGIAASLKLFSDEYGVGIKNLIPGGIFKRSEILKSILFEFEQIYSKIENDLTGEILNEWKENSLTLGKQVSFTLKNLNYLGTAKDIADDGKLIVACTDGVTREISSGEVSVRGILGYS